MFERLSLCELRGAAPGVPLATHVLVGFPGENDADLEESLRLLDLARFERVDVYRYADRPKTAALTLPDMVPEDVKVARVRRFMQELPNVKEFA